MIQQAAYPVQFSIDDPNRPLGRLSAGCRPVGAILSIIAIGGSAHPAVCAHRPVRKAVS